MVGHSSLVSSRLAASGRLRELVAKVRTAATAAVQQVDLAICDAVHPFGRARRERC